MEFCRTVIWLQLHKASDFHALTGVNMTVFVISVVWCLDNGIMLNIHSYSLHTESRSGVTIVHITL